MTWRPLRTPLAEISLEIDCVRDGRPAEFRGASFYGPIETEFPISEHLPVMLVPPGQIPPGLPYAPAIRFYNPDRSIVVQLGPRMVAINQVMTEVPWAGYEGYRDIVARILTHYDAVMADTQMPEQASLGFYNRIPLSGIDDVREILADSNWLSPETQLQDLVVQRLERVETGTLLKQILGVDGAEPNLAINNVFRSRLPARRDLLVEGLLSWMDAVHAQAREFLWNMLSREAQQSWRDSTEAEASRA